MTIHPHGTTPRIRQGCTCNLCTLVEAMQSPRRHLPGSVPTQPVREHIETLVTSGWTMRGLAEHTGYGVSTLHGIRSGRWRYTSRLIAEDILSVRPMVVAA